MPGGSDRVGVGKQHDIHTRWGVILNAFQLAYLTAACARIDSPSHKPVVVLLWYPLIHLPMQIRRRSGPTDLAPLPCMEWTIEEM